jgi:hypothetical protein
MCKRYIAPYRSQKVACLHIKNAVHPAVTREALAEPFELPVRHIKAAQEARAFDF